MLYFFLAVIDTTFASFVGKNNLKIVTLAPCHRCKITRSLGTSASVVGGSLTIAGGVLTVTTAGLAAPLLVMPRCG
jgi:hypothetical protein